MEKKTAGRMLQPATGYLTGFTHSLNPYIGCAFGRPVDNLGRDTVGCPYCYVRRLPVALLHPKPWGTWVTVKEGAPERLRRELRRSRARGETLRIFLGSSTDPYQPVEGRWKITRELLRVIAEEGGVDQLVVQTRSPMVLRDVDLLRALGKKVRVSLTVETDDEKVRRLLTPTSPPVSGRLRALARLRRAGVPTQAAVSPVLPMNPDRLARLLAEAADRVVLDTFHLGDGSGGKRSRLLGMPRRLEAAGYEGWFDPDLHLRLIPIFVGILGPGRVGLGAAGFAGMNLTSPPHHRGE